MGSTGGRPLGEVLQELDGIIKLRQELQTNVELQPLFTPEWFASKIRNKVRELEGSSVDMTMVGGLNNLALLVRLHRILMGKGFTDLYDRLTAAINVQKSYVDCETDIAKDVDSSKNMREPLMGCALPGRQAGKQIFPIKAIGTTTHKLASATAGLHLRWNSNHEALECLEGRSNLTQAYPDFQIQPSKVTMFSCCMDSGKILLGSSIDIESDVALFVHLTRRDNVDELYECLLERSTGTFKRQQVSSDKMEKLIPNLEE